MPGIREKLTNFFLRTTIGKVILIIIVIYIVLSIISFIFPEGFLKSIRELNIGIWMILFKHGLPSPF